MFGATDSSGDDDRASMPHGSRLDRRVLLDVLVNIVPIGILGFFALLFFVYTPYPDDPVVTVIQMALISIPAVVVAIVTYCAVIAVTRDERAGGAEIPPGYSRTDAETVAPSDDD